VRRVRIVHSTRYEFANRVFLGPHRLLLRPREGHELRIESSVLETTPRATMRWHRDVHDNAVAIASFEGQTNQLTIRSEVIVRHCGAPRLDFIVADCAVNYPFSYDFDTVGVLRPYLRDTEAQGGQGVLCDWLSGCWRTGDPIQTYGLLERLCLSVKQTLRYRMRHEPGVQTAAETLQCGVGSCRDFANLFMEGARALGMAARFVSGYLEVPHCSDGATHAWAEVYLPGAGWKGFDPTLGEMVDNRHTAVAIARRPDAVPPVAGSFFGPLGADLYVDVSVNAIDT
jgi:transglutaminase-like putative cysteine protease